MSGLIYDSSAVISDCGLYRYRLDRDLSLTGRPFGPRMAWIMVNPSTADAENDDATIRKVSGFARRHACFRITVGNLFAYRSKDVRELKNVGDPIGPENDNYLRQIIEDAQCVVVAWGPVAKQPKALRNRFKRVAELACDKPLWCFGTANDGHPRHPLMLAYETPLVPWTTPAIATGSREGHDSEAWRGAKQARAARSASPPCPPCPLYDALAEDDDILDETAPSNSQDKSHDPTR